MKSLKVAALLAIVAAPLPAQAVTFFYTGALATYVVPADRWYELTVAGAQGGDGWLSRPGGGGAIISGNLFLEADTVLTLLVGSRGASAGSDNGGGGGGMSFVSSGTTPLIVAGGGGGAAWNKGPGGSGQIGPDGQGIGGGTNGFGGTTASSGAGWYGDGAFADPGPLIGAGGKSWPSFAGGAGAAGSEQNPYTMVPGFGGFGGGGGPGYGCGGGGGGYSGGGGGGLRYEDMPYACPGGGGGSFISADALNVLAIAGGNVFDPAIYNPFEYSQWGSGEGFISIEFSSLVPEPSTWAMMILGFGFCGALLRRRRKSASPMLTG